LPSAGRLNPGNDLHQIYLYYNMQTTNLGKPPARLEDLPDLKKDMPAVYQGIQDGIYVVFWNARATGDSSQTLLAYVKDAPTQGGMVVMLDGSVQNLSAAQFQAALKPQ